MRLEEYEELVGRLLEGIRDADTRKAYNEVFDADTVRTLLKLRDAGYFKELGGVISTGKEANVFYAYDRGGEPLAVKIYRINTTEFRHMWKYLEGDPRIRIERRNRRSIIFTWARREFKNLSQALNNGVNVPTPLVHRKNILIMEYIGDEEPAPLLKDKYPERAEQFRNELLQSLKNLYFSAEIVHADLSEYNILNFRDIPYIIDMGQSVGWDHPFAYEFFRRDMEQLSKILRKLGMSVHTSYDAEKLLREM